MKRIPKSKAIRAYKVCNPDSTCRGFKFEVGKTYHQPGDIQACTNGFHACEKVADCFNYYSFDPNNIVYEVKMWGHVDEKEDKFCASNISIERKLSWEEMLTMANTGKGNSGDRNSGHSNSGHRNSGYWNSGDRNSGYRNSGYSNSGHRNSGYFNSEDGAVYSFNKPVKGMTHTDYNQLPGAQICMHLKLIENIEKPESHTGYELKVYSYKEAWANLWNGLSDAEKKHVMALPNFDADVFKEITGIDVQKGGSHE